MIINGDCLEVLKTLDSGLCHTCVTSPPYYGLRDYGVPGQIGLEATPEEYIAHLVAVFREVRRVLRADGTLWLNLGDSYAGSGKGAANYPENAKLYKQGTNKGMVGASATTKVTAPSCKPKDLIGIPWMVAFALRADGWYLRQDIVWAKPNPMPESVRDRCTKSHEYIFLLSKSRRYYFDAAAIREPVAESTLARMKQDIEAQEGSYRVPGKTNGPMKAVCKKNNGVGFGHGTDKETRNRGRVTDTTRYGGKKYTEYPEEFYRTKSGNAYECDGLRNKRDVWTVSTKPFKGAHFATFPADLIEPCILAGCPEGGIALDPFFGSGTVGVVAAKNMRDFIGIDLKLDYCRMSAKRIGLLASEVL